MVCVVACGVICEEWCAVYVLVFALCGVCFGVYVVWCAE